MARLTPRLGLLAILLLLAGGCATIPEGSTRSEKDPWERYNRSVYQFNDAIDQAVLRPVAKGYRAVTPDFVEQGVTNFFGNATYPVVIINQFLQGDIVLGFKDTGRFLFNSVIGLGGLFDPATHVGLEAHNEDFGQTLGVWGVSTGPYFVLPFLGPSTVRDSVGTAVDSRLDPFYRYVDEPEQYYLLALRIINLRAQLLDLDSQLRETYDPYTFMRDAFLQRREYLVNDGNLPQQNYDDIYDDFEDFEDFEDPAPDEAPVEETIPREDEPGTDSGAAKPVAGDNGSAEAD